MSATPFLRVEDLSVTFQVEDQGIRQPRPGEDYAVVFRCVLRSHFGTQRPNRILGFAESPYHRCVADVGLVSGTSGSKRCLERHRVGMVE